MKERCTGIHVPGKTQARCPLFTSAEDDLHFEVMKLASIESLYDGAMGVLEEIQLSSIRRDLVKARAELDALTLWTGDDESCQT